MHAYIYARLTSVAKLCTYTVYDSNRDQTSDGFCFIVKSFWESEGNRKLAIIFVLCQLCVHLLPFIILTLSFHSTDTLAAEQRIKFLRVFPLLITLLKKDNRMKKVKVGCEKRICM